MTAGTEYRPGTLRLLTGQILHQSRLFWRNPIAAFFSFVFPLMFLLLLNLLNAGTTVGTRGEISYAQFFTPGIAVFAVVTAAYTNLAIMTSIARDEGIIKRLRGTPLPPWIYATGRIGAALWVGLLSVAVMFAVGALVYDVQILWSRMPTALLVFVVGGASFSALGLALAALAPNAQAAPVLANASILPLAFISDIFFPIESGPAWLRTVARIFPLEPFASAVGDAFNPFVEPGFPWSDLAIIVVWGMAGMVVAVRFFSWEPRPGGRRRGS